MDKDKPTNAAHLASASYRLAAMDQDFLLGDTTRGIRFQLEYAKAEESLRIWGVRSTICLSVCRALWYCSSNCCGTCPMSCARR